MKRLMTNDDVDVNSIDEDLNVANRDRRWLLNFLDEMKDVLMEANYERLYQALSVCDHLETNQ